MEPDIGEARRFLSWLDASPDAVFHFQAFDDTKQQRRGRSSRSDLSGTFDAILPQLVTYSRRGSGVFVAVNRFELGAPRQTPNLVRVRAVVVDLDSVPLNETMSVDPPPTLVVESSPGKYQAYWMVRDFPAGRYVEVERALYDRVGGDPDSASSMSPTIVLRLPGFAHQKVPDKPFRSHVSIVPGKGWRPFDGRDLARRITGKDKVPVPKPEGAIPLAATTREVIAAALAQLDPREHRDYHDWLSLMMATHSATGGKFADVFLDWSARDRLYGDELRRENLAYWNKLQTNRPGSVVTVATLVKELFDEDRQAARDCAVALIATCFPLPDHGPAPDWLGAIMARDEGDGLDDVPLKAAELAEDSEDSAWRERNRAAAESVKAWRAARG